MPFSVSAQDSAIKIGVIYDFLGPFAVGGSKAAAIGTQIAIDVVNEQGGVEGHMIEPIVADAQSWAEAAISEDGPYGAGVAEGNEMNCTEYDMEIVLKEGYAAPAPDLSSLATKPRRARADVILHTGYNPDITLFFRQAKEQGLKFKALIGQGAGYGQVEKLIDTFGEDVNDIYNVDPVAGQLLDPATLADGLGDLTTEMVKRYREETGASEVPLLECPQHLVPKCLVQITYCSQ